MKKYILMIGLFLASGAGFVLFADSVWVPSKNNQSCLKACVARNLSPVVSGIYTKNGNPFYVCRSNAKKQGLRAGYNTKPKWSKACVVGFGGKEFFSTPFDCLCAK